MVLQGSECLEELFRKGKEFIEEDNFDKAKDEYEKIIKIDPNCNEAWNNLGAALCKLGRYKRALDAYSRIKEDNKTAQTWYNISLVHFYLRDFEQSLNCIQKTLKLNSCDSEAWDLKGKIQVEQEDYQSAMESFNLAFATDGEPKFLLWDAYSLYLYLEFSKDIDERTQRKLLHMLIRRLERLERITHNRHKTPPDGSDSKLQKDKMSNGRNRVSAIIASIFAKMRCSLVGRSLKDKGEDLVTRNRASNSKIPSNSNTNCDICQQSLYYLGCAYSRYKDYSTAINRLRQCIQENPNSYVAHAARELLEQNWSQIRPSPWKWWFQSPLYLNRRMKRFIAIFVLTLLVLMIILFLVHPMFGLKDKIEWSIYPFVASLLLILLLSPGVEQIRAKDIEIKMHASSPFDPFPSPAKMEDKIGEMSEKSNENQLSSVKL